MASVSDFFKLNVFDDRAMKKYLSPEVYESLVKTINMGEQLDVQVAEAVAKGMRDWAVSLGATHYTHWFQPLTGITAEKHDSFVEPSSDGGFIMNFSGKSLIKGEPDASSFPSGGLRATFEARGYTAWDPTSYAFVKGKTLCIPTAFCSYSGEALDKKTPLLRSMEALNKQAIRVLRALGNTTSKRVSAMAGAEQEYFLVPEDLYLKRDDLRFTGRTLFGNLPPKGQEMDDHYFGAIKPEVASFMEELNEELWKLGILAKTEHNEVAPSQHELACFYTTVNLTVDQNQIVMEMMKKIAHKHHLTCLLTEKPFEGVNGSGKHNNWSMATDDGINLLSPGKTPHENYQFLVFLCAVIKGVDDYQDLLRISVASAGNDHRLGANEAPPAIISMFLGDELTRVLESIEQDIPFEEAKENFMKFGTSVLPRIKKDNTDRNRTSPFAFTGNKFEFRMPGSSDSITSPNIMINSAVAESLSIFAEILEKAGPGEIEKKVYDLVRETYKAHKRIVFNGNGYDDAWIKEAEARGLSNYKTTADCVPHLTDEKNEVMLFKHRVYSKGELESRREIILENYYKSVLIEARTTVSMAESKAIPAMIKYQKMLSNEIIAKKTACAEISCKAEEEILKSVAEATEKLFAATGALKEALVVVYSEYMKESLYVRDTIIPFMEEVRSCLNVAEKVTAKDYWPFPTYGELLFGV
ncbi:MAG: glutamine synthetase III [Bacilli bacterium]|nr:glutamine synthetase III [Bacilli bacterium]